MKNLSSWIRSTLFLLIATSLVAADNPTVTIYNSNLGLVQEPRTLELEKGRQEVSVTDVAARIQPATVHLTSMGKGGFSLQEQNFQYDLVNSSKVFDKYIGERISVITENTGGISGKLLSRDGSILMIQNEDGSLRLIQTKNILEYSLPELPDGLILKPTLQWVIESQKKGSTPVELSYLTEGMSWEAEYILQLKEDDESGVLSSWITLENNAGATFEKAKVKLVAGDIQRAKQRRRGGPALQAEMVTMAKPSVSEREIFEYHLYEIDFPTTLYQNSIKQVAFRNPTEINYDRKYTFEHSERQNAEQENVSVDIVFENSEENNLGMPLPEGVIRLMQEDTDGKEVLVGENNIPHTPKDEEIRVTAGRAFDIVGDRIVKEYERRGGGFERFTVEVNLRNHKEEAVTVNVLEHFYGAWDVTKESRSSTREDAGTLLYELDVAGDGSSTVEFTIERNR